MRIPKLLVVLTLSALAGTARAQGASPAAPDAEPPEDVRARALALLGGIDRRVPAETFRELGPEGEAALQDIALSGELPVYRARALEALALIGGSRAEAAHRAAAADASAPRVVRRAAVRGLGRLAGAAGAPRELRPFLARDRDPAIRAAAAESLASVSPRASCGAIRSQALKEDPRDRAGFSKALAACERR